MGRKSSTKSQAAPPPPPEPPRSKTGLLVGAVVVVAIAFAATFYWRQGAQADASAASATSAPSPTAAAAPPPDYQAPITKPHVQDNLPELQFPAYPTPRPAETVRAAYKFAADHPEVLSYVPCFCGCERAGHRGNEDCFVRERAVNGDVIAWDDHGMECAICLDVADRSRKLFAEGKTPTQIRAAIENEFRAHGPSHTPTPMPPGK